MIYGALAEFSEFNYVITSETIQAVEDIRTSISTFKSKRSNIFTDDHNLTLTARKVGLVLEDAEEFLMSVISEGLVQGLKSVNYGVPHHMFYSGKMLGSIITKASRSPTLLLRSLSRGLNLTIPTEFFLRNKIDPKGWIASNISRIVTTFANTSVPLKTRVTFALTELEFQLTIGMAHLKSKINESENLSAIYYKVFPTVFHRSDFMRVIQELNYLELMDKAFTWMSWHTRWHSSKIGEVLNDVFMKVKPANMTLFENPVRNVNLLERIPLGKFDKFRKLLNQKFKPKVVA
eukprot:TRINITY_DN7745_c0_g1_i4.p1 TRINITY_DN7745_c0_g1~~TRINITY_DN7745_c0_g1_i4.p1  ORF type:complete len:291 (-),score=56.97 TRINITY_DN7745_c0_g1_i4:33-905(-)